VLYVAIGVGLLVVLWQAWRRPGLELPIAFALTTLIAVLIDPHLVDYDLTVLVAAGVLAFTLVPRYAMVVVPLYVVTVLRADIPIADAGLQLTAPLLLVLTMWLYWETRLVVSPVPEQVTRVLAPQS
jgi:hypothetical protein